MAIGIENDGRGAVFDACAVVGSIPAGGKAHGATGEGDVATGAECVGVADLQCSCRDGCAAGIGVTASERERAIATLGEAARSCRRSSAER